MRLKILELIEERGLEPHDPVPSEAELASLFGVSTRTSKQALAALAEEGIVYRLPRRGTFLAGNASSSRQSVSKTASRLPIGVVVPEIDEYIGRFLAALIEALASQQYEAVIRISSGDMDTEEGVLWELAEERGVEGIILFPGDRRVCGHEMIRLHLKQYPIVVVDRVYHELNLPSVCHDHFQGALEMTHHLIENGHTRIGFISEPIDGVLSREERYQGFIHAHVEANLPFVHSMILTDYVHVQLPGEQGANPAVSRLDKYLESHPGMTAVFCSNDFVAMDVVNAAVRLGIPVPDQLSVVGFTDLSFSSRTIVPLTTIRKSPEQLAYSAVGMMTEYIRHPGTEPANVRLRTELIQRSSVASRQAGETVVRMRISGLQGESP